MFLCSFGAVLRRRGPLLTCQHGSWAVMQHRQIKVLSKGFALYSDRQGCRGEAQPVFVTFQLRGSARRGTCVHR